MEIREEIRMAAPDQVVEPLLGMLDETATVPLAISGSSMTPFLAPGREMVFLSRLTAWPKRGDVVLYRRDNGRYVLHRVLNVAGESYTMLGDAQTVPERGIRRDQILAVVTAVRRKGKLLKQGSFCWFFFRTVWIRLISLRPLAVRVVHRLKNRV